MSHIAFVALSGFRVREREMLALGMSLPGLASRAGAIGALPSLGLLTLAGLTPDSWSMSYHDPAAITDGLVHEIVATRPTLVAISALTASILDAYSLADRLRAQGVRVVLGGLHVTVCPDEAALHADAIVIGDGEPVWPAILADAAAGSLRARYQASPFDLANAPIPRFDLLGDRSRPRFTLQTARGCPLACDFCGASRLLGPFREKPVERIEAELAALCRVQRRPYIELADDNTFAGRREASALLGALERSGVRYFTEADWRIGERPEVVERLAASGCVQVLMGFESLVHPHAGMGAKSSRLDRMIAAAERLQDAGVAVIACFILGSDGEDEESMARLGEFLLSAPFADIQLTLLTPFPGTALHRRLGAAGRLLADRDWSAYTLFDVTYRPDRLSPEALQRGFYNLVKMVFAAGPTNRRDEIRRAVWARRVEAV
jgi:radical SAM superfamily enzyme YgiQ (UPF0313 family)